MEKTIMKEEEVGSECLESKLDEMKAILSLFGIPEEPKGLTVDDPKDQSSSCAIHKDISPECTAEKDLLHEILNHMILNVQLSTENLKRKTKTEVKNTATQSQQITKEKIKKSANENTSAPNSSLDAESITRVKSSSDLNLFYNQNNF